MELMIQKALNERNDLKKMSSLRNQQATNQESPKSSWFSFRKSRPTTSKLNLPVIVAPPSEAS